MHKKAVTFAFLALSVAAVATTLPAPEIRRPAPVTKAAVGTAVQAPVASAPVTAPPPVQNAAIGSAIERWRALRSPGLPFSSYASFLTSYRGWPAESTMRRYAERAINDSAPPSQVIAYFRAMPPLTASGQARYAIALQAAGRGGEAVEAGRLAWRMGVLPQADEDRLLSLFGASIGQADHEARLDALLDAGDVATARRIIGFTAGARRPVHEARIALQSRAADASDRVNALGAGAGSDAGLLMDRVNWLRNTGQSQAARQLAAQPRTLVQRPADVAKFLETMLGLARGAANDGQWTVAYQLASQLTDVYPAGTDVGAKDYDERDHYTSLAWLAGTTALHQIGRPADAARMFELYAMAARSPQTNAKGFYWAGRAATVAQQPGAAAAYFGKAAVHPDQFYGQLSAERTGRAINAPSATPPVQPSAAGRAAFQRRDLVQAVRYLGQTGRREDQSLFVRALADQIDRSEDRALAGELAREIQRPDLGVWVARQARNDGVTYYARSSFPEVQVPDAYARQWTLNHAIMRQESSFDRAAVSSASARGMMQLMPATARETAGKVGVGYDLNRLTSDPQYNILLGSRYFSDLMNSFGNYPPLAVAAYNAGPGNVRKWIRQNGDPRLPGVDVVRWIEEIPFFETKNYVQRVLENAVVYDTMNSRTPYAPPTNRLSTFLGKQNQPG